MVVQHNLTAMNSNRMLGLTTKSQAKSTERLSSGYKINRAADDAAGLAISEKMRKQIRGLTQASANAQDGISAVQTAEGALTEVQDMLQRMNELAVKAANGTQSASDREAIQSEIDELVTEIDRVSETTKFNETYLLKGDETATKGTDFKYKEIEALSQNLYYVEGGEIKTLEKGTAIKDIDTTRVYYSDSVSDQTGIAYAESDSATVLESKNVFSAGANYFTKGEDGEFYKVEKGAVYDSGTTYYSSATVSGGTGIKSQMIAYADSDRTTFDTEAQYLVKDDATVYDKNGNKLDAGKPIGPDATDATNISNYFSEISGTNFINDTVALDNYKVNQVVQFVDKDGNEIASNGLNKYIDDKGKLDVDAGLYIKTGKGVTDHRLATQGDVDAFVDSSAKFEVGALTLKLHVGADATTNNQIALDLESMSAKTLGVNGLKVDGEKDTNALNAIETIKAALDKVSAQRSTLGAIQNRLEHTINNLDNVVENTTSAESQIRDTDMATEMVRYSNNNILAQAGQAMLAQANQVNQGVLSLLG